MRLRLPLSLVAAWLATGCGLSAPPDAPTDAPRYIVTAAPLETMRGYRQCVAVDPTDPTGVWWWEPGPTGCSTRSTGPGVFRAERARVVRRAGGTVTDVRFALAVQLGPPREIHLVIDAGRVTLAETGATVGALRRSDLNVPGR